MADINDIQAAQTTKLVGSDTDGTEQTPVKSTTQGSIQVAIADRPSEFRNRTSIILPIINQAIGAGGGTVLRTTTVNQTAYITGFCLTVANYANVLGRLQIRNGTTPLTEFYLRERVAGGTPSIQVFSCTFEEPLPFTTNINLFEAAGTVEVSGHMIGYEEPN